MKTDKYGDNLYLTEDGRWVPWYISNLLDYGNTVLPEREGLTEDYILKKYKLQVVIKAMKIETLTSMGSRATGHYLMCEMKE